MRNILQCLESIAYILFQGFRKGQRLGQVFNFAAQVFIYGSKVLPIVFPLFRRRGHHLLSNTRRRVNIAVLLIWDAPVCDSHYRLVCPRWLDSPRVGGRKGETVASEQCFSSLPSCQISTICWRDRYSNAGFVMKLPSRFTPIVICIQKRNAS